MNIPFSKISMGVEEEEAVIRVLRSGWLAAGPETEAFEQEFSDYISPEGEHYYCIFTNSCTSALKMAYNIAKELGYTGIFYPRNTFVATYSAAAELGLVICPMGGYDGNICETSSSSSAPSVEKVSETDTTHTEESSVLLSVTEKVEKVLDTPKIQSSNLESLQVQKHSLLKPQQQDSTKQNNIGLPIPGLKDITVEQMSAMSVKQLKELVGQIKTIPISENVINGRDYAQSVTTSTTKHTMGYTNVHFSSIKNNNPCLIEDSAHRIESNDPLVGLMRCYSFYATKNLTTGSGGAFVTKNKEIYELARNYWRDGLTTSTKDRQSGPVDYTVTRLVSGYDGGDVAASMGRVQLRKLTDFTRKRNEIRERYNAAYGRDWMGNHLYCFDLGSEDRVKECRKYLWEKGIGSGYHYPGTGWTSISLPIFPDLTEEEQNYIIKAMKEGGYAS